MEEFPLKVDKLYQIKLGLVLCIIVRARACVHLPRGVASITAVNGTIIVASNDDLIAMMMMMMLTMIVIITGIKHR